MLVKLLCEAFGVTFEDSTRLHNARLRAVKAQGRNRAAASIAQKEATARAMAAVAIPVVLSRCDSLGPVIAVLWRGSNSQLEDVRVVHENGVTDFSCKAAKSGSGTCRNPGFKSLVELFGLPPGYVDFPDLTYRRVLQAWSRHLHPMRHSQLRAMRIGERKDSASQSERAIAADVARGMNVVLAQRVAVCWLKLDQARKVRATRWLSGTDTVNNPDLFYVIANDKGVRVGQSEAISDDAVLTLEHQVGRAAVVISVDGVPTFRVNFNATGGLGISPACARAFRITEEGEE